MLSRSKYERQLIAAAVLAFSVTVPALAADTLTSRKTDTTAATADARPEEGHAHHHGHPMPPFMHELHQLSLTDAQKQTIRALFDSKRETLRSQMDSLHTARRNFDAAQPGTSDFINAQAQLEQAEVAAAQMRVRNEAELKTKIYAVLTDEQKTKLQALIAEHGNDLQPPPPPPGE